MIYFVFLFLMVASMDATEIEANQADYDGNVIHLTGDVHIKHEFGEIFCQRGQLIMAGNQKRMHPSRILLDENVKVKLKDGSVLTSDEADIDCNTLIGLFTATAPQKVSYLTLMQEGEKNCPVKATSRAMRVTMKKALDASNEGKKSEYIIQDVQAIGAVNIEYQNAL